MKAYFSIGNYKDIPIIPEDKFNDVMDGNPDSMSFSFVYNEDLTPKLNIKQKCKVVLIDDIHNLEYAGKMYSNRVNIGEETYYINELNIFKDDETIGYIYEEDRQFNIEQVMYYIGDTKTDEYGVEYRDVYLDRRKQYNLCLSQISGERMSTIDKTENKYVITVLLKEQTILLKDCVRTDITISPELYPKVNGVSPFSTLLDAAEKIVDCHNMCILNDRICSIDNDLQEALSNVACPNLTYRDLSTYSQLHDVLIRVGRIPYYENGILYGIKQQGNKKETTINLNDFSQLSTLKQETINDNIYSTKLYNIKYDNESAVVPEAFRELVDMQKDDYFEINNVDRITKWSLASYINPFAEGNIFTSEALAKSKAKEWVNKQYDEWKTADTSSLKRLLFVNGFNTASSGIDDARQYYLELPYDIELVEEIYWCKPKTLIKTTSVDNSYSFEGYFGFELQKIFDVTDKDNGRLVENTYYNHLSSLQKRIFAYYVKGNNRINNIISLIADENYLQGSVSWSDSRLYDTLKSYFFVVKYKPLLNGIYTNYDYTNSGWLDNLEKPLAVQNYNLPYKFVSDKQIYPQLEYSLEKGKDTTVNTKIITDDFKILDLTAGDIVSYNNSEYIINKIEFLINNVTIEAEFELTTNIVQNSIISNYSDNVRVSSNISTESVVDRPVHFFGEAIVRVTNNNQGGTLYPRYTNIFTGQSSPNYFIRAYGEQLVQGAYYNIGLNRADGGYSDNILNINKQIQFPFQLSTLIPNTTKVTGNATVSLNTSAMPNANFSDIATITSNFTDADLPLKIVNVEISSTLTGHSKEKVHLNTIFECNDLSKLQSQLDEMEYYALYSTMKSVNPANLFRIVTGKSARPSKYVYTVVIKNYNASTDGTIGGVDTGDKLERLRNQSGKVITFRGPLYNEKDEKNIYDYWNIRITEAHQLYERISTQFGAASVSNFVVYTGKFFYNNSNYLYDYLYSTSGLISKVDYLPTTQSYTSSSIDADDFFDFRTDPDIPSSGFLSTVLADCEIKSEQPVLFNTSDLGCVMNGFADGFYTAKENQSINMLPTCFNKGYIVDMNERIHPYIQFKVMLSNKSSGYYVSEISQDFKWLDKLERKEYDITKRRKYDEFRIVKINKKSRLSNLYFSDYQDLIDKTTNMATVTKYMDLVTMSIGFTIFTKDMGDYATISKDDEYDYALVAVKYNESGSSRTIDYYTPMIKFNVVEDEDSFGTLYINYYINDSYENSKEEE